MRRGEGEGEGEGGARKQSGTADAWSGSVSSVPSCDRAAHRWISHLKFTMNCPQVKWLCWRDMHLVTLPPSPIHPPFVPLTSSLLSLPPPPPGFVGRDYCCAACSLSFWTDTHLPPARRRVCLRNYAIATFFHEELFGGR